MISKEQWDKFFDNLESGMTVTDSCMIANISDDAVWIHRKKDKAFDQRFIEAKLAIKKHCLGIIKKAAVTHWAAAAWILERRFSDDYALKTKQEMSGKLDLTDNEEVKKKLVDKAKKFIQTVKIRDNVKVG